MTAPLPPVNTDPSVVRGREVRATYLTEVSAVRGNPTLSDLGRAQQIAALWETANNELATAYRDLVARMNARADELAKVLPDGPNVPGNASAADAAVLHQAFRAALGEARAADRDGRKAMLADAVRFDDDVLLRATLTAAVEAGDADTVNRWAGPRGLSDQLTELAKIRDAVSMDRLQIHQALSPLPRPEEAAALPQLEQAAEQQAQAQGRLSWLPQDVIRNGPLGRR